MVFWKILIFPILFPHLMNKLIRTSTDRNTFCPPFVSRRCFSLTNTELCLFSSLLSFFFSCIYIYIHKHRWNVKMIYTKNITIYMCVCVCVFVRMSHMISTNVLFDLNNKMNVQKYFHESWSILVVLSDKFNWLTRVRSELSGEFSLIFKELPLVT